MGGLPEGWEAALLAAAEAGDAAGVSRLAQAGADLNVANAEGKTVAMLAAGAGRDSVLRALTMKRGPSLFNLAAADGGTPAMSAAVHGETGALKEILEVSDLNAQDEDGWTALMFAACAGHPSSVAALLDAGADASIKNKDGATAHDLAQERGYDDVIRALVEPKDARA